MYSLWTTFCCLGVANIGPPHWGVEHETEQTILKPDQETLGFIRDRYMDPNILVLQDHGFLIRFIHYVNQY